MLNFYGQVLNFKGLAQLHLDVHTFIPILVSSDNPNSNWLGGGIITNEPPHGKTNNLHMRKQRRSLFSLHG